MNGLTNQGFKSILVTVHKIAWIGVCMAFVAMLSLVLAPTSAYADDELEIGATETVELKNAIVVTDANGSVMDSYEIGLATDADITSALKAALATGKAPGNMQQTTVTVPAGSYTINTDLNLQIFSNTHLVLDADTVIKQVGDEAKLAYNFLMLEAGHYKDDGSLCIDSTCNHGGQTQFQNVTIEGGTWDANCASHPTWNVGCALLQHGSNLTIKNATFKNCTNHAINVAGTHDVTVTNCTFKDAVKYTGVSTKFWGTKTLDAQAKVDRIRQTESVHTDFCCAPGELTAYPLDGSACENVTVSKCTFTNTYSGVGTHHPVAAGKPRIQDMSVTGCAFTLKDGNAVNLFSTSGATVKNNTCTGGYCLSRVSDSSATITDNEIMKSTGNAVGVVNGSTASVKNNTITHASNAASGSAGVMVSQKSVATVQGNSVTCNATGFGVHFSESRGIVTSNKVKGGTAGIAFKSATGACTATNNEVSGASGNGIYVWSSSAGKTLVQGNTVTGATQGAGVRIDKSGNVEISKNTLKSCKFGVSASSAKGLAISGNSASGGNTGIAVSTLTGSANVTGNTISTVSGNGVYVNGSKAGKVEVSGNKISKATAGAGVRINNSASVTASTNTLTNCKYGVSASSSKALSISGNKASGGNTGISLATLTGAANVASNTISTVSGNGVYVSASKSGKITVQKNKINKATKGAGVRIDKSVNVAAASNTIANSKYGVSASSSKALSISGNKVSGGNTAVLLATLAGAANVTGNTISTVSGHGIYVNGSKSGKIAITSNKINKATAGAGINVNNSANVTLSKNVVANSKFGANVTKSKTVTISQNKMSGGDTVIRVVTKSTGIKVANNTLKKLVNNKVVKLCKSNAIYFYDGSKGTISKNVIVRPGTAGVRIAKNCTVTIVGNKITKPGAKAISLSK